jgi:peptidoglycan/LPS O-acetylase OafA/YrhL
MAMRQTCQGLMFLAVVAAAARGIPGRAGAFLAHPAVVYLGRISYGIYLAHNFAPLIARGLIAATGLAGRVAFAGAPRLVLLTAVTVGAAALSWHLVEAPFSRLKMRFPY